MSSGVVLLDGPMGTELANRGVATPLPSWSAGALRESPDVVLAIHRAYAAAGATVHTTNTFRTRESDLGSDWRAMTGLAVRLAREGASGGRVAGSIAPLGDCYRPDESPGEAAYEAHAAMAEALVGAGCDLVLCETFPAQAEAIAAVRAARDGGAPEIWASLTAGPDADLFEPLALARAAATLGAAGASVVLVNCTPALKTLGYVRELARVGLPFGAYANAGEVDDAIGWRSDPAFGAARYAEVALRWVEAGASVVGGCCGTGPAHVRELKRRLR